MVDDLKSGYIAERLHMAGKTRVHSDKENKALGLLRTAYNDYIAARVLLNKGYTLQGMILASTAVEKYLKMGVCAKTGEITAVHMDKFDALKQEVIDIGYEVLFQKIDPLFFDLLSKVYPLRYYDNVKDTFSIGFFKNQLLGELDTAVYWFDQWMTLTKADTKEPMLSPVRRDFQSGNVDFLENNWVASKEKDKKKFMETDCVAFGLQILPVTCLKKYTYSVQSCMCLITVR